MASVTAILVDLSLVGLLVAAVERFIRARRHNWRDVDGRRVAARQRSARAGIAVVVDRQRQGGRGARIVGVVDIVDRVEDRVDLRQCACDGHRLASIVLDRHAASRHRQRSFGHRQRRRLGAAAAVDIAHRYTGEVQALLLGRAVARRRDRRHRRVVHRREVDGRRVTARQRPAGAGIAVVVDRQRQRRARRRRVGVIDIADRAGAIGVEQRVDLHNRAGDRHRRCAAATDRRPASASRHRQRSFGHRQRRRLGAAAAVDIAHRQPVVLKIEALLLGRAVARRRDRRHRRVVHRREVEDGRRVTAPSAARPVPVLPLSLIDNVSVALAAGVLVSSI